MYALFNYLIGPGLWRRIVLATLLCATSLVSIAEQLSYGFQYEIALGGRKPVRTLYSHWQSRSGLGVSNEVPSSTLARIPLYSSDTGLPTALRQLSRLDSADEEATMSLGESLRFLVGGYP